MTTTMDFFHGTHVGTLVSANLTNWEEDAERPTFLTITSTQRR